MKAESLESKAEAADKPEAVRSMPEAEATESKASGSKPDAAKSKADWRYELLDQERRTLVLEVVATGVGICSRCRWTYGCHKCDEEKALRYHLGKQGYLDPAVWNC